MLLVGLLLGAGLTFSFQYAVAIDKDPEPSGTATLSLAAPKSVSVLTNTGGFTVPTILQYKQSSCTSCSGQDVVNEIMIDVNGDGLTDIANVDKDPYTGNNTYLNNGDGTWVVGKGVQEYDGYNYVYHYTDINGDGKVEQLQTQWQPSGDGYYFVSISGTGLVTNASVKVLSTRPFERGLHFMDVNGDSLPDMVISGYDFQGSLGSNYLYKAIFLNTGIGWEKVYEAVGS